MARDARPAVGKSLWSDAWHKICRSRVAVTAMIVLSLVVLGAFFTPILPLQPSDRYYNDLEFILAPPNTARPIKELGLTLDGIRDARIEAAELKVKNDKISRQERDELAARTDSDAGSRSAAYDQLDETIKSREQQVNDTLMRPYRDAGFSPDLGLLTRWMVRTRVAVFGQYQIPSILGRDKMGRDLLSRIFWGARVSLVVALVATAVSLSIGVTYGAVSGYAGGWVDSLMMRIVDVLYSVPFIFIVIFALTILSEEQNKKWLASYGISRITIFYVLVGLVYWLTMSRVVRGQVLSLKHQLFVEAARSQGASSARIVFWHLIPNVASVVIVYLTLTIPNVMLFESFLSFLGLGVQSPDVSWGTLAKEGLSVITPLKIYWWVVVFPSMAIGITLLALNFFGDALRDALDPRLRTE